MANQLHPASPEVVISQASSHFPLEPVSALVLCDEETRRRNGLQALGPHRAGCSEVDDQVLLGGFERGCVVGVSAEHEDFGILLGLQTIAQSLVSASDSEPRRASIITPQPPGAVLPILRDAVVTGLKTRGVPQGQLAAATRARLERVAVSRVFDLDGVAEVLGELGLPLRQDVESVESQATQAAGEIVSKEGVGRADVEPGTIDSSRTADRDASREVVVRTEIADSEDEEDFSPLASPDQVEGPPKDEPAPPGTPVVDTLQTAKARPVARETVAGSHAPHLILITNFGALLTGLFAQREKEVAHDALHRIASQLRHHSRTLPSSPLIILANGTASSDLGAHASDGASPPKKSSASHVQPRPLDPTLSSIFNYPPPPPGGTDDSHTAAWRRRRGHKPSFGLVFSQLLDIHLLCTRVPRTKDDAEWLLSLAPGGGAGAAAAAPVTPGRAERHAWVVECLLDELGVWDGPGKVRTSREQRWGAVDVQGGRIVNAFAKMATQHGR